MQRELSIETHMSPDGSLLVLSGELDIASAPRLRAEINALVAGGVRNLVVDLHDADFIDAVGLGAVVQASKLLSAHGGRFSIVRPKEGVMKIFTITGLAGSFEMYDTPEQAAVS